MKRRWKLLIFAAVVLAVLLAINTVVIGSETKPAAVNAPDGSGRICHSACGGASG